MDCNKFTNSPCPIPYPHVEELGASLHSITASDVIGAYMGESERRLREVFEAACNDARTGRTVIVFLDEVGPQNRFCFHTHQQLILVGVS